MKRTLLDCFFLALCASFIVADERSDTNSSESSEERKSADPDTAMMIYRAIFKQKRDQQMIAAEDILKLGDYSKQYRMVELVLEKIFKLIQDSKTKVMESGYIPGEAFPSEQTHLEALSNILENTAFFGDILLRLPDITHKVYRKSKDWELIARWSVSFCNETQVFDETDTNLLNLMAQELRLVPRDPNYRNPYRKDARKAEKELKNEHEAQEETSRKKKKKEKKKRGPRLSHAEL